MKRRNPLSRLTEPEDSVVVDIRSLSKTFDDHVVLRGIDLQVKKGENVVVLGKSGSGKSTLIRCMVGLTDPDEGTITIMGKDISETDYDSLNDIRREIGFLFQNAALYDSMTVRENLAFPLRHHHKELSESDIDGKIQAALDEVGLGDAAERMPAELSGGMSKRIGLARTLIMKPNIMLYDEPTTGLDTATAKEISQLINDMQRKFNISSIIITHDIACARMTSDRVVMLKEGVIVAEGTYDQLAASDDEWIKSFFN